MTTIAPRKEMQISKPEHVVHYYRLEAGSFVTLPKGRITSVNPTDDGTALLIGVEVKADD
jgi:hypothetical protein